MHVPIITDSLGEEGRYKVHLLMQGLPHKIQKYTRAFRLTSIDKNLAFLTLVFPPPLKHLLTYMWQSVQKYACLPAAEMAKSKRRQETQKEAVQAFYNGATHDHRY